MSYFINITFLKDDDFIMVTKHNRQFTRQNTFEIINKIYKNTGIKKKGGVHLLRHTFTMRLTKKGVNPLIIKKALRYSL